MPRFLPLPRCAVLAVLLGMMPCLLAVFPPRAEADTGPMRYEAVFADGARVEGRSVRWASAAEAPKLDDVELFTPTRSLRWLRDVTLPTFDPVRSSAGFVEMIHGDRLCGSIAGFGTDPPSGARTPGAVLRVAVPAVPPRQEGYVRVLAQYIRRIVFGAGGGRRLEPGTAFFRDGRRLAYRSLRWSDTGFRLLTDDGIRDAGLDDLDEIHFPARDSWDALCDELLLLSTDLSTRLVRLDGARGDVVTGAESRLLVWAPRVPVPADPDAPSSPPATQPNPDPDTWYHGLHPVWSLDPIWMPFRQIRSRSHHAPTEVPLSRLQPIRAEQRALLATWPWRADRSLRGGLLASGGQGYAWGFAVHAPTDLWFDLPDYVEAFEARAGLDHAIGPRGCARAAVFLGGRDGQPLWRSAHLVGSGVVADSGRLSLAGGGPTGKKASDDSPAARRLLVLAAEDGEEDRPAGADPLDIGDMLHWLEPTLHLDPARLRAAMQRRIPSLVPAWRDWTVTLAGEGPLHAQSHADDLDRRGRVHFLSIGTGGRSLALSSQREIGPADNWLVVRTRPIADEAAPGSIEVRVDDRPIARFAVPPAGHATPALVCMRQFQGRTVQLELVYTPADDREQLAWHALAMAETPTQVQWTPLRPVEVRSMNGSKLSVLPDLSILAEGDAPANDIYTVVAEVDMPGIRGFRLETIPDDSLPGNTAGRGPNGEFMLTRFTVAQAPRAPAPVRGRYVRIELPSEQKYALMLAEVQVFSDGENVALGGTASQQSTADGGEAGRAIDGNTNGMPDEGSVSQTKGIREYRLGTDNLPDETPWWEVDLGEVKPLERIVVWNRSDTNLFFLKNYHVRVLDAERNPVWERTINESPVLADEFDLVESTPLVLSAAGASREPAQNPLWHALRCPYLELQGWALDEPHRRIPQVAMFAIHGEDGAGGEDDAGGHDEPAAPRSETVRLMFKLKHCYRRDAQWLLGRFRISATTDASPWPVEPVGVEVPLLDE